MGQRQRETAKLYENGLQKLIHIIFAISYAASKFVTHLM